MYKINHRNTTKERCYVQACLCASSNIYMSMCTGYGQTLEVYNNNNMCTCDCKPTVEYYTQQHNVQMVSMVWLESVSCSNVLELLWNLHRKTITQPGWTFGLQNITHNGAALKLSAASCWYKTNATHIHVVSYLITRTSWLRLRSVRVPPPCKDWHGCCNVFTLYLLITDRLEIA